MSDRLDDYMDTVATAFVVPIMVAGLVLVFPFWVIGKVGKLVPRLWPPK